MASLSRDFPIEDIVLRASERLSKAHSGEPTREALSDFRSLVWTCEKALGCILEVDSKSRPVAEWMAAVDLVERIKNESLKMVGILEELFE